MDEREEMTAEVMYGSKTKQAYELIKQKILMLEYAPGQPLRELELSEQLSMSRTPIRAAIERLVADCFVDETAGKRTVVSGVSVDSFVELYEIREAMETLCVSLAAYAWQDHSQIDAAVIWWTASLSWRPRRRWIPRLCRRWTASSTALWPTCPATACWSGRRCGSTTCACATSSTPCT